jgi:hypothetical protein
MRLLIVQFSAASCYFLRGRSENLSQLLILKYPRMNIGVI